MKLAIQYDLESDAAFANNLAKQLGIALDVQEPDILIQVSDQHGISLSCPKDDPKAVLSVSFDSGAADYRRQFGGGKSQMIAKAVGIEAGVFPAILDATAGLGGDAFVFASLGSRVTAVERSGVLFAMLERAKESAMKRALTLDPELLAVLDNLSLSHMDGVEFMLSCEPFAAEVIYLDPMFPERKKSAAVKKEMRILQALLQDEVGNEEQLLELSLTKASHRVVVKRPKQAPPIKGLAPGYALQGKSTRFDIYPIKTLKATR